MVTGIGPAVLSGGVYDQLQVPAASFLVTVPSEAVSVTVPRPRGSSKVPVFVTWVPSLTVTAAWLAAIVGGAVVFSSTLTSGEDWDVTRSCRPSPLKSPT